MHGDVYLAAMFLFYGTITVNYTRVMPAMYTEHKLGPPNNLS